ncbi:MAG: hypothetical protein Q8P63_01500 [Candidatus Nealsonbacteria bacterium]|nr:hypothetical protein [Candidatus Nealsonbacteria bacterium]
MNNEQFTLNITDKEIIGLLSAYAPDKREVITLKALRIGLIALKDIESVGNIDYVEKEFQKFKSDLDKEFVTLKESFSKILQETDDLIKEKLKNNFDPETGIMSRVMDQYLGEGGTLADLFDEQNNTSAVSKIKTILSEYFDEDASTVVRLLDPNNPKSPLSSFKKDIMDRLVAIEKEITAKDSAQAAAKAEAKKGTQKGFEYEELVFMEVEKIAHVLGDTCLPTGKEIGQVLNSKLGDTVVTLNSSETGGATLKIVFEAKDKEMYLSTLLDELEGAQKNRGAGAAIGVVSGKDTLKDVREAIGVFRDYPNKRAICVLDKEIIDPIALEVAYKLARTKLLLGLQTKEMKSESIDIATINILIDEIKNNLSEFTTIKSTLTKATGTISNAQTQIDAMKADLVSKLDDLSEKATPK